MLWSLSVGYERITGCESSSQRSRQAKQRIVGELWDDTPNDLDEQARYNLATDFINVLNERTEGSYLKEDMKKGIFHIIKKNEGAVPDSKRQGRPPLLSEGDAGDKDNSVYEFEHATRTKDEYGVT